MESYFLVHLLYYEEGLGAAASKNSLYSSPGDSSMHVRAFIMFLLWSKKEYGLLKIKSVTIGSSRFFK